MFILCNVAAFQASIWTATTTLWLNILYLYLNTVLKHQPISILFRKQNSLKI